ncbi:MAG: hypothetical protein N3D20_02820 [Candidatus Pacearchaeota archaeon]|nr:hypothetical protein [Candidatus Pacearchaeota archaeon]
MKKDYINLLVARISKKEIEEKNPDWIVEEAGIKLIKNEAKEKLKDVLLEQIWKRAKEQDYYIFDEVIIRETQNSFVAVALAYPKFVSGKVRKMRPPKLTPEQIIDVFKKKIDEIGIMGVSPDGILTKNNEQHL